MAKYTKKVRIVGKYGTHYDASLRKMVKKIAISQCAKYTYSFCGKTKMKSCGHLALWPNSSQSFGESVSQVIILRLA
uniref:60S ribosomal protein L37a n=1 Tax=Catagonus wagneri TaxID=51154 RepID=A0A8C3YCN8_9CETA